MGDDPYLRFSVGLGFNLKSNWWKARIKAFGNKVEGEDELGCNKVNGGDEFVFV